MLPFRRAGPSMVRVLGRTAPSTVSLVIYNSYEGIEWILWGFIAH